MTVYFDLTTDLGRSQAYAHSPETASLARMTERVLDDIVDDALYVAEDKVSTLESDLNTAYADHDK